VLTLYKELADLKDLNLFLSTTMVTVPTYTASNGAPVSEPYAAQRAGLNGPLLLQGMHVSSLSYPMINAY
jgi:hypothetical protein